MDRSPWYTGYINKLIHLIFDQEEKRLRNLQLDLLKSNHLLGFSDTCYIYNNIMFSSTSHNKFRKLNQISLLDESLSEQADYLHSLITKKDEDKRKVNQIFSMCLIKCKSSQNVRDCLPDSLVCNISEFDNIPRLHEATFIIQEQPVLVEQYLKVIDIINYYMTNKLIYPS